MAATSKTGAQRKKATRAPRRQMAAARAAPPGSPGERELLDVASRLLATEGDGALSMRRVASEAGVSTMVLYSRFGSREGLVERLLVEGHTRFANELSAVSLRDPFAQLRELGHAYRRFAQHNPTYYPLMWAPHLPGADGKPAGQKPLSPALQAASNRSYGALVQTVTRVLGTLDRPARDVEPLALSVWAVVHGFVSLELSGVIPAPAADAAYRDTLAFIERGLRHPPS